MKVFKIMTAGALAVATVGVGSTVAHADDTPVAASSSTYTLPLLGVPLTVDVTTDAGGGLLEVALGSPDDYVATGVHSNKVTFVNETDGSTVRIKAKHGGQRIEARVGALSDLIGVPGGWSGDLFETGDVTTVSFEVADRGDGTPDIVNTSVTPAPDVDFTIGATTYDVEDDDGEQEASARVRIDFSYLGQTRTMTIKAEVDTDDGDDGDGPETSAKLKISLSRIKGRQILPGDAVGPHTWTGMICAGPATIDFVVAEDGSVTDVVTDPSADVRSNGHGASIRFSKSERVTIKVLGEDGDLEVSVAKKVRCEKVDPTVNTDISPKADKHDDDEKDDDEDEHDGTYQDGGHHDDGHHDDGHDD